LGLFGICGDYEPQTVYNVGWAIIGITLVLMGWNFVYVIKTSIQSIKMIYNKAHSYLQRSKMDKRRKMVGKIDLKPDWRSIRK